MRYHKEEVADVGTEGCYVKHCRSTRCAFVLTATVNGMGKDVVYIYEPMNLDRQAERQGGLLAWLQCSKLAICFLQVLSDKLDMTLLEHCSTYDTSSCIE